MNSKLYFGKVSHTRMQPIKHRFEYATFMCFLDIDELTSIFQCHPFWSYASKNLAWFNEENYIGRNSSIRDAVSSEIKEQTGSAFNGRICILTHLTYFGYCFNPVSFYYCYDEQDQLAYIVSEINNTPWNERHCYVTRIQDDKPMIVDSFEKEFHVSPFLDMDFRYQWQFSRPGDDIIVNMDNYKEGNQWFNAYLEMQAEPITRASLSKALRQYPFMTMKVVLAIYWQALKLKVKGAKFYDHPNPDSLRTTD